MGNQHYYSGQPGSNHEFRDVRFKIRGVELTLTTDAGVFSKRGIDFGTRVLLEAVELHETDFVVDLGCGYGVVTAVLARVYPETRWLLLDVNERAVNLAMQNVSRFGGRVDLAVSDGFGARDDVMADAIIANPPIRAGKSVVYRLFEESKSHLRDGGALWVVIHKKHGAASAAVKLGELFEQVDLVTRQSGYHIFRCS
jgi:16S rRNA (guanine1207-N2)-methyltransferase